MIYLQIPLKPVSVNDAFQGKRFKTKLCKQYEIDLWNVLPRKSIIVGMVEIRYVFHLINHALTDYDNLIKVTQDILTKKRYFEDDRKIYKATIIKVPSLEDRIEVYISFLDSRPA